MGVIRLLILLFFPFGLLAQSKDEKRILAILDQQTQAWNTGDLDSFMKGYWKDDSLMYIGKSGVTYGYQRTLDRYKRNYAGPDQMGTLSFQILHLKRLDKRHYLVVGKWSLKRRAGDIGGHYTLTFKKKGDSWVIIADHSS